jgi:O-antigen/teichoic acid export membrane protein
VLGAASGWAVAEAVVGVTSAVVIFRLIGPALKLSTKCLKEMLSFGIRSYAELFFLYLNYQIDMIMVSVYTAPEQVGYYSIAFSISRMILILPTSIGIVLYPRLSSLRVEEADFFTARVMRNVIFVISIGLVAVAFLSKWIIQIMYGKAYLPATRPLLWLLPGVLAISMYKQLTRNFLSRGKPIYGAYISGFGLASAVLMNLLFIPRFGIAGAAAASSLAFLGMALIALVLFIKTSDINLMDAVFVRSDDLQDLREHVNALKKKFSNF